MKKEELIRKLDVLIMPERLLKSDDSELKHADRRLKSHIQDMIKSNLYVVLGMPAIDKEYNDADVHSELGVFTDGITDATWRYVIFAMVRLNAYTKTKLMNSKFKNEVYKLKKRIVRMLLKYAPEYIVSETMHIRFNEELGEDEYFMQYTILNGDRNSMIHQPWRNVKSLYSEGQAQTMIAQALEYDNSEPVWEFDRTDEERIRIEKMFSHLALGVMIMEKNFNIDNYFVK